MSNLTPDAAATAVRRLRVEQIEPIALMPDAPMDATTLAVWLDEAADLRSVTLVVEGAEVTVADVVVEPAEDADADELIVEGDEERESVDEDSGADPVVKRALAEPERRVLTLQRTMRSGAAVRFDGDVVLHGDLNPGSQIVAAGNILVLGHLKGMAHAGCTGDESATILAFDLRPTQLRIARHIAIPPEREPHSGLLPEIARVDGDQIAIEPYRNRSPRQAGA